MVSLIHTLRSVFTFDITRNSFFPSHTTLKLVNSAKVNTFSLNPVGLPCDVVISHAGRSSNTKQAQNHLVFPSKFCTWIASGSRHVPDLVTTQLAL